MATATRVLVGIIAALHVYFMILESFLWTTPYGRRVFGTTAEVAESSKSLAQNQGLYNGFLAAGLGWSLLARAEIAGELMLFFLACVLIAGIVGGVTASKKILVVQALPAAIALGLVLTAR